MIDSSAIHARRAGVERPGDVGETRTTNARFRVPRRPSRKDRRARQSRPTRQDRRKLRPGPARPADSGAVPGVGRRWILPPPRPCAERAVRRDQCRRDRARAPHGGSRTRNRRPTREWSIVYDRRREFLHDVDEPEDKISKLYNLHREAPYRTLARRPDLALLISGLLGPDVDIFNSQYIFKNPGAWGQPWHQDSLYFQFNRFPQAGVWLATSEATAENGCLYVLPGSHREPIHEHLPDSRADANLGYVEIRDHDFSGSVPVLMEPGDILVFHSFLMHRSADNTSDGRRTAVVDHYGQAGTRQTGLPSPTVDWMPIVRDPEFPGNDRLRRRRPDEGRGCRERPRCSDRAGGTHPLRRRVGRGRTPRGGRSSSARSFSGATTCCDCPGRSARAPPPAPVLPPTRTAETASRAKRGRFVFG